MSRLMPRHAWILIRQVEQGSDPAGHRIQVWVDDIVDSKDKGAVSQLAIHECKAGGDLAERCLPD